MKIAIQTQYRENYGAHDWDGVGECPQYWKCKGGSTYILRDISVETAMGVSAAKLVEGISKMISSADDYSTESVIGWELLDNCEADPCDDWEIPWTVMFDIGAVSGYTAYRENKLDDVSESYVMEVGGKRSDYRRNSLISK